MYRHPDPDYDRYLWELDHPEPPELDQIDVEHYRSACCTEPVTQVNQSYKCTCCTLFCRIDEEATLDTLIENIKEY